jgi:rod shape-determining protein MreB
MKRAFYEGFDQIFSGVPFHTTEVDRSAELVEINAGAVSEKLVNPPPGWVVKGKSLTNGIPVTRTIDHTEVSQILDKSITAIEESVVHTLERCPPEHAADLYQNGIHITGATPC